MLKEDNEPQSVNTAHLTDADWAEVHKIKQAYTTGGQRGFEKALDTLYKRNQLRWLKVVWAYYPTMVSDAMKVMKANCSGPVPDFQDIFGNLEHAPTKH